MKRSILGLLFGLSHALVSAQTGQPIKVGATFHLSGGGASYGQNTLLGAQFAVEVLNKAGGVLGRQVALEVQDNGTNAQRAVNQAAAMARDGAVMLMAPQTSGSTIAVSKQGSAKLKVPLCNAISTGDDVTMKEWQPYIFSTTPNQYMSLRAIASRVAKQGHKRIGVFAPDNAGGRLGVTRFLEFMKQFDPQAQVVVEEFTKLGNQDYTTSFNKILAAKPDYVFSQHFGTDLITIAKQGGALGFFKQINNNFASIVDSSTLKSFGDTAPIGINGYARAPMNHLLKSTPAVREFLTQFKARHGDYPADESTLAYDCLTTWAAAVTAAKTTDADAVMRVILANEFNTVRGKIHFRKIDHMADVPTFIGKVAFARSSISQSLK